MSYCLLTATEFFYRVFYRWLFCFILLHQMSTFTTASITVTITAVTAAVIISGLLLS